MGGGDQRQARPGAASGVARVRGRLESGLAVFALLLIPLIGVARILLWDQGQVTLRGAMLALPGGFFLSGLRVIPPDPGLGIGV